MTRLLSIILLAAAHAAAQPADKLPRPTTGLITPIPAQAVPTTPPPPTAPQCQVIMRPLPGRGPENPGDAGQLTWNVTWDASVSAAQRAVIQFALDEWRNIVLDTTNRIPNPYPITIQFTDFGATSTLLALTSVSYFVASGNLSGATMSFNTRTSFYVDATPGDDSEFSSPTPPAGTDLLTVARHELGHAVGFTQTARIDAWLSNGIFDAARLNIGTDTTTGVGFHTSPSIHPNELMNPSIGPSTRRPISLYPSAALVARAFEYRIPMSFIDPNSPGSLLTGTVNQPYQTIAQAASAPILLFAPTTHHVPLNTIVSGSRTWSAARGGSIIVAP
ncbi:MAG: hypothetical protein KF678_04535 [Phycisphaeraceae bacterium]|nr:hypothetical protein [Phycisphaeraceae bacterium]